MIRRSCLGSMYLRWMRLGLVFASVAIVWCTLLPHLANQPAMKRHLKFLDDKGIDPSAMFYTELEMKE